ncbi:MAG TPA: flagellar biosynthesis protein [Caldimonas sp.]|nr:flagellar biosynthesis protein [Caldimonas sp.]
MSSSAPLDQAHGLRRLFEGARVRFVPLVSNPHVACTGLLLERISAAFAERGLHTLVIDASERAPEPSELAVLDLAACVQPLSQQVSFLAARGLPIRHVDAQGSTAAFLHAAAQAAPEARVVLVHAAATDLCRLFGATVGEPASPPCCPVLIADDRPASVMHAYAAMKLMALRARLRVHELLLAAPAASRRAERIATQLASCADHFLDAVLRHVVRVDPLGDAADAPNPALRRWARERLVGRGIGGALADVRTVELPAVPDVGTRFAPENCAFNPAALGA